MRTCRVRASRARGHSAERRSLESSSGHRAGAWSMTCGSTAPVRPRAIRCISSLMLPPVPPSVGSCLCSLSRSSSAIRRVGRRTRGWNTDSTATGARSAASRCPAHGRHRSACTAVRHRPAHRAACSHDRLRRPPRSATQLVRPRRSRGRPGADRPLPSQHTTTSGCPSSPQPDNPSHRTGRAVRGGSRALPSPVMAMVMWSPVTQEAVE